MKREMTDYEKRILASHITVEMGKANSILWEELDAYDLESMDQLHGFRKMHRERVSELKLLAEDMFKCTVDVKMDDNDFYTELILDDSSFKVRKHFENSIENNIQ